MVEVLTNLKVVKYPAETDQSKAIMRIQQIIILAIVIILIVIAIAIIQVIIIMDIIRKIL